MVSGLKSDSDVESFILQDYSLGTSVGDTVRNASQASHSGPYASTSKRRILRALFSVSGASGKRPRPTAWLDGLRGVAATEVVLHHYHHHFLGTGYNYAYGSLPGTFQWWRLPVIRNYYHSAHAMVNVFFVISGFVLTQKSLSHIRTRQLDKLLPSLSSAVFRRLLRIFLPVIPITFFGMILVRLKIKGTGGLVSPVEYQSTILLQVWDWYKQTEKFLNPFHNYENPWDLVHTYEHVMWTLPVEYYGSIVCFLTVLATAQVTNTMKRAFIMICVMYLAMRRANWWSTNFLSGTLLADFVLSQEREGSHSRMMLRKGTVTSNVVWSIVFIWSFYLCGLPDPKPGEYNLPGYDFYISKTPESFRGIEDGGRFWWMLAGIGLTVSASQLDLVRKLLETRLCQHLGKVSFMLYLSHVYVWESIGKYWLGWLTSCVSSNSPEKLPFFDSTMSTSSAVCVYLVFWITMIPVVAIISGVLTTYVDDPSVRFAKWLEEKFIMDD